MKYIAAFILVGACLAAALPIDSDFKPNSALDERWEKYKVDFKKDYKNAAEEAKRREIWEKNVATIDEQNKKFDEGLSTWLAAENQFTDRTDEEKNSSTGLVLPSGLNLPKPPPVVGGGSRPIVGLANPLAPAPSGAETKPEAVKP